MQVSAASRSSVETSSAGGGSSSEHIVKSGETLSGIAAERGVSLNSLLAANPQIVNPNLIRPGQAVNVPPREGDSSYVIKPGDTLSAIGAKLGVSWQAIAQANNLRDPNLISPNQELVIPGGGAPSSTPRRPANDTSPATGPTTGTATGTAAPTGALPSTEGMSNAQKFELYSNYVNTYGDAQAKADLADGKQVILGLRTDTALNVNNGKGAYDDRVVVLQAGAQVREFSAATEPSSQYDGRFGGDADSDGRKELGRIAEGTVTFSKSTSGKLGDVLRPTEAHSIVRDTNHDGRIGAGDKTVQSTDGSFLFHAGGNTNTGSAGCQTMKPGDFQSFWSSLGDQSKFNYVLVNVGTQGAPTTQAQTQATTPANTDQQPIGGLSEQYESGGRGPGTVSSGTGDPGGVSYGTYQLAGNRDRPQQFLANEGQRWAAEFGNSTPGSAAFSATWREIAAREPEAFEAAQHDYIQRTHYQVQADQVQGGTGIDVTNRSAALRDVVWSTAVQHGPETQVIARAIANVRADGHTPSEGDAFDRALINAIYDERGRRSDTGGLAYFTSASAAVQTSVANRFAEERRDALNMLNP
ncbi:LysM domain-containing protein [Caulobacter sp.]|uniref:VgrG-related protein n=1 Tax=Caulobacter sp. TaxID=78 RepID=UPI001622D305